MNKEKKQLTPLQIFNTIIFYSLLICMLIFTSPKYNTDLPYIGFFTYLFIISAISINKSKTTTKKIILFLAAIVAFAMTIFFIIN